MTESDATETVEIGGQTFTEEEWNSREITIIGVSTALCDILFMAIFLAGGLSFLAASVDVAPSNKIYWGYVAVALFLVLQALLGYFTRLTRPRDHYQVRVRRSDGTIVVVR